MQQKIETKNQSVYVMRDKKSKEVKYVGITNDPKRRQKEHDRDQSKEHLMPMEVKATNLSRYEARILEQTLISAYTKENLDNARREIAVGNLDKAKGNFDNIICIFSGVAESDLLTLMGR